ncbi:MAG: hypothetical protein LBV34_08525 [Nocardiopsaceae bacterium]|jgi:hypothetical protein|nr:hypothetical protein [Nocardiopsaceae bacterium]
MDPTGNQPDEVTEAALETVSQAVELAEQEDRRRRRRGIRAWISRRVRRRAAQTERVRRLSTGIGGAARRGAHVTGRRVSAGGRWLSSQVLAMAPRLPVRDLATLRRQFPDQTPDQLAESLIEGASKASAAVGIAVGTWAVLPFVPAAGVEITTETLAVVGIEIKLVAELHEVYGQAVSGNVVDRMTAYVGAWSRRRGVSLAPGGLVLAAGSPLARQLQRRLAAKASKSVLSLGPLLTGAAAGGLINRRETRKLGRVVSDDLRKRAPYGGADWKAPGSADALRR